MVYTYNVWNVQKSPKFFLQWPKNFSIGKKHCWRVLQNDAYGNFFEMSLIIAVILNPPSTLRFSKKNLTGLIPNVNVHMNRCDYDGIVENKFE